MAMKRIFFTFTLLALFLIAVPVFAAQPPMIELYYSPTCPHCTNERNFLEQLQVRYPDIEVKQYPVTDQKNVEQLRAELERRDALQYFGVVPITFIGEEHYIGFDQVVADALTAAAENQLEEGLEGTRRFSVPFLGGINPGDYSLPVLAVVLGFLDGFNVCSLGALILILSLVLALRSRGKIAAYGGMFILTTAVVYGFLIMLWYQLFLVLAGYLRILALIVGAAGVYGGIYFLKEFIRMRRHGVTCDAQGLPLIGTLTKRVQKAFESKKGILVILSSILIFVAVITAVEFPCSAAVPVVFAGILADSGIGGAAYYSLLGLFLLFYMLDELIIFAIAVWKMNIWMTSARFTVWTTLVAGLLLLALGGYYFVTAML